MKNEGFFSSDIVKTFAKKIALPPSLSVELPPTKGASSKPSQDLTSKIPQWIMDIECYVNYFLVKFMNVVTEEFIDFEMTSTVPLDCKRIIHILENNEIITFNGNKYDMPMLRYALSGASNQQLKWASNELIQTDISVHTFIEVNRLPEIKIKHIDLIELPIGIVSLKIYGGRLHCQKMQDLPIDGDATLTDEQMDQISEYCRNDLKVTKLIFVNLLPQIALRRIMSKRYKQDLMSKSDAQIAEAVIKAEVSKVVKGKLNRTESSKGSFYYQVPDFINFNHPRLKDALDIVSSKPFVVGSNGRITMPDELSRLKVEIGSSTYKLGMGGLHSSEKSTFHISDDKYSIYDWDVASYYPEIIRKLKLYPKQLTKEFMKIYSDIVDERLEAKRSGDKVKADSLKITINGSFGKFGSPYSALYAPELMVQVTITGQLSLLMLIDMMERKGISIVSGNTDGVVIKCPKDKDIMMRNIIKRWESVTGFEMEETNYAGIYSRDVNNYMAIKTNGEVKAKGTFALASISKNPENDICTDAMIEYLKFGTTFMHTIKCCHDVRKFLTVRSVKGGAVKDGEYIGKAVRFYHSTKVKGCINYKTNGNMVPNSEKCRPLMELPESLPKDIDYDWYETKTKELFG